jgi:trehalose/maltose hydrolase-like predicted phosphorylase
MKPRFFALLCLLLVIGDVSAGSPNAGFELTASAADFDHYFPGYLANGYVSTLTGPRGTEGNLSYMVGLMDYAADDFSRPAAIPGWTEIDYSAGRSDAGQFWMNQVALGADIFQDYRQTLNLHDATLTTNYRYLDHGKSTTIQVRTFVSQADAHLAATEFSMTPDFDGEVQLQFALNLWAPYQPRLPLGRLTGEQMQEAVAAHQLKLVALPPATPDRAPVWYHGDVHVLAKDGDAANLSLWLDGQAEQGLAMAQAAAIGLPAGLKPISVELYRSQYRLALNLRVKVEKNKTYTFTKTIANSRDGWGGNAKANVALAQTARADGFERLLTAHRKAWAELWKSDIVIDGDAAAQLAVRSDLYYLLSSSTANTAWPLGACALTTGYAGHVFWDSDSWIFPALLLLHPERAKSLIDFRARTLAAAQARAKAHGYKGAMFPWEADPERGTEETPHFAAILGEREIHINADIAISQWQYWLASQDKAWLEMKGWPVIREVAAFWASRVTWNEEKQRYDIDHVTSVEENFTDIPNDSFTNASVRKVMTIAIQVAALVGAKADPVWHEIAEKLVVPFDARTQRYLDFDASVEHSIDPWGATVLTLLSYPSLDLPMSPQVRRNDYAHAMQPIQQAHEIPATMGLPPISIAAATMGDTAEATKWFDYNHRDELFKPPFNVRAETTTNNTGYFITASAGFLQNLIYGFSGMRIEPSGLNQAYAPVLPAAWRSLTFTQIAFRGKHYRITIERDANGQAKLTRHALD